MLFRDRIDAGCKLAIRLQAYAQRPDVVVLGLARGGVPVAFEVAMALGVPLDVFVVRKLGVPGHRELAMGAIAEDGSCVLNERLIQLHNIQPQDIEQVADCEQQELERRKQVYRRGVPLLDCRDRTVIVVDDGLATGATMRVAIDALRHHQPRQIIVAVPIAAPDTCDKATLGADEAICVETPQPFHAIGLWYENFTQTTDEEVCDLLQQASRQPIG